VRCRDAARTARRVRSMVVRAHGDRHHGGYGVVLARRSAVRGGRRLEGRSRAGSRLLAASAPDRSTSSGRWIDAQAMPGCRRRSRGSAGEPRRSRRRLRREPADGDLAGLIEGPTNVITHCNTGAGNGGHGRRRVIRSAWAQGASTRLRGRDAPLAAGSRLRPGSSSATAFRSRSWWTGRRRRAWRARIGWVSSAHHIAANGDTANKIDLRPRGRARHHGVRFMVARRLDDRHGDRLGAEIRSRSGTRARSSSAAAARSARPGSARGTRVRRDPPRSSTRSSRSAASC